MVLYWKALFVCLHWRVPAPNSACVLVWTRERAATIGSKGGWRQQVFRAFPISLRKGNASLSWCFYCDKKDARDNGWMPRTTPLLFFILQTFSLHTIMQSLSLTRLLHKVTSNNLLIYDTEQKPSYKSLTIFSSNSLYYKRNCWLVSELLVK